MKPITFGISALLIFLSLTVSAQLRKIEFGASVGFPTGARQYDGVVEASIKYGVNHWRFFDPFVKTIDTNVSKVADLVSYYLVTKGASTVLISLGNNAYSQLKYDTVGRKFTPKQYKAMAFTNRCFPKDTVYCAYLIKKLCKELQKRNLLNKCEFELGDETDAELYWWGTPDEAKRLFTIKYNALKEFNRPIIAGSFTISSMSDTSYNHKGWVYDYAMHDPIYNYCYFSSSFYWTDSRVKSANDTTTTFNVNDNDYPTRNFSSIYLTEYSEFTGVTPGSLRDQTMNTVEYLKKFIALLTWIYDKPQFKRIYVHPICEYGPVKDPTGTLGLWRLNVDPKTFQNYYTLKPCGKMFYDLLSVVKDGYEPIPSGIQGRTKKIVVSGKDYTISNR